MKFARDSMYMEIKIECKYSDIDLHLTIFVLFATTSKIVLLMLCRNNAITLTCYILYNVINAYNSIYLYILFLLLCNDNMCVMLNALDVCL